MIFFVNNLWKYIKIKSEVVISLSASLTQYPNTSQAIQQKSNTIIFSGLKCIYQLASVYQYKLGPEKPFRQFVDSSWPQVLL